MSDQNARLLVFLKKIEEQPSGWRLAHIHISQAPGAKKTRQNITMAIQKLNLLKGKYADAEIFLMQNFDIVFASKAVTKPVIASTGDEIQEIFFGKGPVNFVNVHGNAGEFCTVFELGNDYAKALAWAEKLAGIGTKAEAAGESKKTLDPAGMAKLKDDLSRANISLMLFNQPIYFVGDPGKAPQVLFQEVYMSVQLLEETLCPGFSLTARKWLFADLTEELDAAALKLLSNPVERTGRKRFSLNINLSTLNSDKFSKFDGDVPPEQRPDIVLEINKTDMFENMLLFRKLTPFLRERGYRILIDGTTIENLLAMDFDGIECDFAKVFWSADAASLPDDVMQRLKVKLNRAKPRFVLGRCDTAESMRFARTLNIRLVQGRMVDHMVKKNIPL